ncbi:MAG: class I SAM-dependent rRNA methyltransferase [Ardenticatenaceae bacterium]|nr:class I SAM-dependent rRNA methyltransferase [Ardenticatenaceae bacterium]
MINGKLFLKRGREKPVLNRHPWVFSGAIQHVDGEPEPGDLVQVVEGNGRFLATALYNPHSQIQGRILTWWDEAIDEAFWRGKIERALRHRAALKLEPATNAYRLINAEADGLPGLVVDKYGDFLVMQCLTFGMDSRKTMLAQLLAELVQPQGIIERSDVDVRQKEGLAQVTGVLWGEEPTAEVVIHENGHSFGVDLLAGHKTGFYLDQRENRTAVAQPHHVAKKTIINAFAYTGGFAIYAAAHEAAAIINIDSSIPALEQAERNMALNGFERPQDEYIAGDVFEVLRYYREEGQQFDMIILDPPKFVHSQRDLERASRGYKDLNLQALHLLRPGGVLATFSCSGLVSADLFQKIVFGAAVDAQREVQIMQSLSQPADHPVLLSFPESAYLKGLLCRVW